MNLKEYRLMREVEDTHWWYEGLRGMIQSHWASSNRVENSTMLDAGCGAGANLVMMSKRADVLGLDFSPEALSLCHERGLDRLLCGSVSALPLANNTFDGVLMMDVLYHRWVPDKSGALEESVRVLKPGGLLLVNVPAYQWLMSSHDKAIHTDKRFTKRELGILLVEAGLEIERITYWNTLLFIPAAVIRMLRKNTSKETDSDLSGFKENFATRFFRIALRLERGILRIIPLPFGLSVFAVARKSS